MNPCYIAVEKFSPKDGQKWEEYIRWSGLSQLTELVSLDICLCNRVLSEFTTDDYKHFNQGPYLSGFFQDLGYLLKRVGSKTNVQILAAARDPSSETINLLPDSRFEFKGYDLLEVEDLAGSTGISALTNCGGFDKSFSNSELSEVGLIKRFARVREIQKSLATNYPDEPLAQTTVWALWRMNQ